MLEVWKYVLGMDKALPMISDRCVAPHINWGDDVTIRYDPSSLIDLVYFQKVELMLPKSVYIFSTRCEKRCTFNAEVDQNIYKLIQ